MKSESQMDAFKARIRAAGGIVHADGNIFFTNAAQLDAYVSSLRFPEPSSGANETPIVGCGATERNSSLAVPVLPVVGYLFHGVPPDGPHACTPKLSITKPQGGWPVIEPLTKVSDAFPSNASTKTP